MRHLKNIGLGLVIISASLSIVLGSVAVLCYSARWVLGEGYDWVGPVFVLVLGGAWLVGAMWRE